MKPISVFFAAVLLMVPSVLTAQDAVLEERLKKLEGHIQDLIEAKNAQNKRIEQLTTDIRELQDRLNKPAPAYAAQQDVVRLGEKLQEIDQKRREDNELIVKQIEELGKTFASRPVAAPRSSGSNASKSDMVYKHTIRSGDTLSTIVAAYREQNIRVTVDQILAANPGLEPTRMPVGKTIDIPVPQ